MEPGIILYAFSFVSADVAFFRIAVFYGVLSVGFLLASLSSSYALRILGYFVMYLTASCGLILAWLIILLFIEESVANPEREVNTSYMCLFL